jgi:hypothetical protein
VNDLIGDENVFDSRFRQGCRFPHGSGGQADRTGRDLQVCEPRALVRLGMRAQARLAVHSLRHALDIATHDWQVQEQRRRGDFVTVASNHGTSETPVFRPGIRLHRRHNQIGKPPALLGDSRSVTVPGIVVQLGVEFALFPLTPALSPRRGRALARCWKILTLRLRSPLLCLSFWRHTTTKLGRITKARANVSPSPGGEGWGEGEHDNRSLGRLRFGLDA